MAEQMVSIPEYKENVISVGKHVKRWISWNLLIDQNEILQNFLCLGPNVFDFLVSGCLAD